MITDMNKIDDYLSGKVLYGDDFSIDEIEKWYRAEEEGYAGLVQDRDKEYRYEYEEMNKLFGFKYLENIPSFDQVLGIGSAFGNEFIPVLDKIKNLTIVEPSQYLRSDKLVPEYVSPKVDGSLEFEDARFDLITCFATLHHIPNVSHVLSELVRVLAPGGILLLKEPVRSMGDWRVPRKGLTKNERGIPIQYFDNFFNSQPVRIIRKSHCDSLFLYKILTKVFKIKMDSPSYQKMDALVSKLLKWNVRYDTKRMFHKLAPGSIFYVIRKN
mgnify:FL=1